MHCGRTLPNFIPLIEGHFGLYIYTLLLAQWANSWSDYSLMSEFHLSCHAQEVWTRADMKLQMADTCHDFDPYSSSCMDANQMEEIVRCDRRSPKMQSIKESAAIVAATAKSGLEKTKAVLQEKVEKTSADNPMEEHMATEKKEERIHHAEHEKQEHNAAARAAAESGTGSYSHSAAGDAGKPMGGSQMSALPGHGTGEPAGQVTEGVVKSNPIGTATGTERSSTAHNTRVEGGASQGYGTGGTYSG